MQSVFLECASLVHVPRWLLCYGSKFKLIFNRVRLSFLRVLCGLERVRQDEMVSRVWKLKIPG